MKYTLMVASLLAAVCLTPFIKSMVSASDRESRHSAMGPAVATQHVVIHTAGIGNPYINFEDGFELPASYQGAPEMRSLLKQNAAEARALASADFDEDGVPDLICGYARPGGGIITLYRGNVDSIYQNSSEAQRRKAEGTFTGAAFLSPARVFESPIAADFVGAGDFDADGHCDVVIAARGGKELCLLPGDGQGSFLATRKIALAGAVTSLITGEINRADGLTDVVVGVVADDGPKALIFEGPEGALKTNPEIFSLPGEPGALALGQFDDDYPTDLAVGAGSELVIIHGRDRKLSPDEFTRAEVLPAVVDRRSFGFEITSIAAGDFTGANESLALLAPDGTVHLISTHGPGQAGTTKRRAGDTQVLGTWRGAAHLVCARVSTGPGVDLLVQNQERNVVQVLKVGTSGPTASSPSAGNQVSISLDLDGEPLALLPMRLNADALSDLVILRAGQVGPAIVKTRPATTYTVINTNDGGPGSFRQAILDANANPGADSIAFSVPGPGVHTISPTSPLPTITDLITIDATTQPGFVGSPIIELDGVAAGMSSNGLQIVAGNSIVHGLMVNRFGQNGIFLGGIGGNSITGNFLGVDATGNIAKSNSNAGVRSEDCNGNTIGGTTVQARNVIASDVGGFRVVFSNSNGNFVQGNYVGVNVLGTAILNSGFIGVGVYFSLNNVIGGTTAGARNIISGSTVGVQINGPIAANNSVQGNFIGTDAAGANPLGNLEGISMSNADDNMIGGTTVNARNVISGNMSHGLAMRTCSRNVVQGNFIGTGAAATSPLPNAQTGVLFEGDLNVIGGTIAGARNVISGNGELGIYVAGTGNIVLGNFVGTDVTGTLPIPNAHGGMNIFGGNNSIGGTSSGSGNIVAFNGIGGVFLYSGFGTGVGNAVRRNSIFSNSGLGIVLDGAGVIPNDPCDGDVGANNLQNFPALTSVTPNSSTTGIEGTLNSAPNTAFAIEFFASAGCDPSGFGEGQTFIGSATLTTGADCEAAFNITLPVSVAPGAFITATATDPAGNTSEFSACVQVSCGYAVSPSIAFFAMNGGAGSVNVFAGGSACAWFAAATENWITIVSADNGTGNGAVDFEVRENFTGSARLGNIKIADQLFTIVQDAGLGDDCQYSISPMFQPFPAQGGSGGVNVFAAERCAWQAVSNANWITITAGSVGIGNGSVSYSVAANPGASGRKATITIGGRPFAVKQKGQ